VVDDGQLRRYLLGELEESEQEALERDLMTSDERFQELLIAEEEVVDDFCAGKLSATQEQEYRDHFLVTPERRRKHRFGTALRKHIASAAPTHGRARWKAFLPIGRPLAAAAAVALLAAGVFWIVESRPVRLEQTAQIEGPRASVFLTRGSLRSLEPEAVPSITVPAGIALVELQLDVPPDTRGEQEVTLENARTGAVLARGRLPARTLEGQWVVVAAVPAERLDPGDYRVRLRAPSANVEAIYEFRVSSR
jgi:hypothetical protein